MAAAAAPAKDAPEEGGGGARGSALGDSDGGGSGAGAPPNGAPPGSGVSGGGWLSRGSPGTADAATDWGGAAPSGGGGGGGGTGADYDAPAGDEMVAGADATIDGGAVLAAVRAIAASAQAASEAAQTSAAAALASAAALQAVLAALPASVTAAVIAAHTQHVTAQGLGAQRIRDAAAMARVQGDTMQEIASKNKLELFGVGPGGAAAAGARLVCIPCGKHGNHVLREAGVFDCSPGRLLHVLRGSLARHFAGPGHKQCVTIASQEEALRARRRTIAMSIGRAAYFEYKEATSFYSYERLLLLLHLNGVDIGTLNHSRKFPATFVSAVHAAIAARLKDFLDRPSEVLGGRKPGISLNADKATELRRTGQILGAVILIGGVLTPILLADSIVLSGESDAAGLAKKIMDCITQVNRGPLFRPFVWAHKYV